MRNFVKPSLIMLSTFVVIHLIAYIIQFNNIDQSHQAIQLKETKVSMLTNIIQEKKKEIKLEMSSLKNDIPVIKISKANKVVEKKILPSGEMTP